MQRQGFYKSLQEAAEHLIKKIYIDRFKRKQLSKRPANTLTHTSVPTSLEFSSAYWIKNSYILFLQLLVKLVQKLPSLRLAGVWGHFRTSSFAEDSSHIHSSWKAASDTCCPSVASCSILIMASQVAQREKKSHPISSSRAVTEDTQHTATLPCSVPKCKMLRLPFCPPQSWVYASAQAHREEFWINLHTSNWLKLLHWQGIEGLWFQKTSAILEQFIDWTVEAEKENEEIVYVLWETSDFLLWLCNLSDGQVNQVFCAPSNCNW